jgi:hypothetical protein
LRETGNFWNTLEDNQREKALLEHSRRSLETLEELETVVTMDQGTQPTQGQDGLIQELREGMAGLQQTILALRTEMQQLRAQ